MTAYYNEIDPFAATWLRELIKAGHIAPGDVDERSIEDVRPSEVIGYTQCHFFAGIGGWSYALRMAGWADDRSVWTGSCPCQPFSTAGKRGGTADERHLWPSWFHLISQCRPPVILGEQVEAAIKQGWLDLVQDDLEGIGYAVAPHGMAACNLGAPHIRKRLWFVADSGSQPAGRGLFRSEEGVSPVEQRASNQSERSSDPGSPLVNPTSEQMGVPGRARESRGADSEGLDDASSPRRIGAVEDAETDTRDEARLRVSCERSPWSDCDWLPCIDGKSRPVEPGTFPLAHGVPNRVGKLRGYGNAIVPQVAAAFIEAYEEVR